jgi:hypothetical protein
MVATRRLVAGRKWPGTPRHSGSYSQAGIAWRLPSGPRSWICCGAGRVGTGIDRQVPRATPFPIFWARAPDRFVIRVHGPRKIASGLPFLRWTCSPTLIATSFPSGVLAGCYCVSLARRSARHGHSRPVRAAPHAGQWQTDRRSNGLTMSLSISAQKVAIGLIGEPVPPPTASGAAVRRNAHRFR